MDNTLKIPFSTPYISGNELTYVSDAIGSSNLTGDNFYTTKCNSLIKKVIGTHAVFLTPSGTASLEMSALLASFCPGDEIIMPSYTFSSTANAMILRGGVPVFVDIRSDTLNIDETKIEEAIGPKTKGIVVVHYAGVVCEMDEISKIAKKHNLILIEDAAQAYLSKYKGKSAGSLSDLSCFSFHGTKNISCGEGGAFCVNRERFIERAEILREKGTDRAKFLHGEVDKYTWRDMGSSFLANELSAAYLLSQLEAAETITSERLLAWNQYHTELSELEQNGLIQRNYVPVQCEHNAHIYFIILNEFFNRDSVLEDLKGKGIHATSHYEPLHSSPYGRQFLKKSTELSITDKSACQLLRLPLWPGIAGEKVSFVVSNLKTILANYSGF